MARVTVEDCLENVENRFDLVIKAAARARLLELGAADAQLEWDNDKPTVMALREIAAGLDITKTRVRSEQAEVDAAALALSQSVDNAAAEAAMAVEASIPVEEATIVVQEENPAEPATPAEPTNPDVPPAE